MSRQGSTGIGRRHWLGSVAAIAFGGTGLVARRGAAFQLLPEDDYRDLIENRCGTSEGHRRQLVRIAAARGIDLSDRQARDLLAGISCPLCGCPLLATLPEPAARDPS